MVGRNALEKAISGLLILAVFAPAGFAQSPQGQTDEPVANPGRPTVSNPATLTPVGYLQFESGILSATHSSEFSRLYDFNEVVKLAVSRRLEFIVSAEPVVRSTANGTTACDTGEVFLGVQIVLVPGRGSKPTIAASYSHPLYEGGGPDLDVGSPRSSAVFYASADVKGFHYDANAVFNEIVEGRVRKLQVAQTLSISHPIARGFGVSGEIWRFSQPFMHSNAVGNLWAVGYTARRNLVLDAGFEKGLTSTSTRWEVFAGFTYLLPARIWRAER